MHIYDAHPDDVDQSEGSRKEIIALGMKSPRATSPALLKLSWHVGWEHPDGRVGAPSQSRRWGRMTHRSPLLFYQRNAGSNDVHLQCQELQQRGNRSSQT